MQSLSLIFLAKYNSLAGDDYFPALFFISLKKHKKKASDKLASEVLRAEQRV